VPEYQAFKTADKAVKKFLKGENLTLKDAVSQKRPETEDFLRVRDQWFRAKAQRQAGPTQETTTTAAASGGEASH
jgi:hypothetical protein